MDSTKNLNNNLKNTGLDLESFETKIPDVDKNDQIPKSPSYVTKNIETRVNLGNPGKRGGLKNYTIGKITDPSKVTLEDNQYNALDKITAMPLYSSEAVTQDKQGFKNDLVKFRIGVVDNKDPNKKNIYSF